MQIYLVGGAVRDRLLGRPVVDRDYVVVGADPAQLLALGYRPVGKDFPVFLHPQTNEEYALARTERKSGRGYKGFTVHAAPDVTLEDDLRRRDSAMLPLAKNRLMRRSLTSSLTVASARRSTPACPPRDRYNVSF